MAEHVSRDQRRFLIAAFALVVVLAVLTVVWVFNLVTQPADNVPPQKKGTGTFSSIVLVPQAGFPGAVNWAGLVALADDLPSAPGWEIRYNAAATLARRGSPHVPLAVLREMLDEDRQMKNFRIQLKDGRDVPNEGEARMAVLSALKAVHDWHKHSKAVEAAGRDSAALQALYQGIDKLMQSPNRVVSTEAKKVRLALGS
jgi:hypothetical protein